MTDLNAVTSQWLTSNLFFFPPNKRTDFFFQNFVPDLTAPSLGGTSGVHPNLNCFILVINFWNYSYCFLNREANATKFRSIKKTNNPSHTCDTDGDIFCTIMPAKKLSGWLIPSRDLLITFPLASSVALNHTLAADQPMALDEDAWCHHVLRSYRRRFVSCIFSSKTPYLCFHLFINCQSSNIHFSS